MSTDTVIAFTGEGLVVNGVVVGPRDMADWFEQYRLVEDYFDDHDDCIPYEEFENALEDQRNKIWQHLGNPPYNYHDDRKHPGAIRWCTDAACKYVTLAALEEDMG